MFYNSLVKFLKKFNNRDNLKNLCYYTVTVSKMIETTKQTVLI